MGQLTSRHRDGTRCWRLHLPANKLALCTSSATQKHGDTPNDTETDCSNNEIDCSNAETDGINSETAAYCITHSRSSQCKECKQSKQKQCKRCRQCEQVYSPCKTCNTNSKTATDTTTASRELLDTVPDEILLMIMSALPRSDLKTLNSVCHRLFRMINQTLWDEPVFKRQIEYKDLESFSKIKYRIKVLKWSHFLPITPVDALAKTLKKMNFGSFEIVQGLLINRGQFLLAHELRTLLWLGNISKVHTSCFSSHCTPDEFIEVLTEAPHPQPELTVDYYFHARLTAVDCSCQLQKICTTLNVVEIQADFDAYLSEKQWARCYTPLSGSNQINVLV